MKKIKVALIHNIISPYRIPVFNKLAKNKNIDLIVYFLNETAKNRNWNTNYYKKNLKFKYEILPSINIKFPFIDSIEYNINPTIFLKLHREKFDVIITSGWVDFACQTIPFFKKAFGYKFILWAGSTKNESSFQRKLTLFFVKLIIKKSDYFIPYGSESKKYLISLGANKEKIADSYNSIDVTFFRNKVKGFTTEKIKKLKRKYNIPLNKKVILYVGQFIPRKNVTLLIKAVALINKKISLVILGSGRQKQKYIDLSQKLGVDLIIIDHLERDKIPQVYAIADLFILPSIEEVWGLVVNEAMACALPIICSDKAGCVNDLIVNKKNGNTFISGNLESLVKEINSILYNSKKLTKMGKESKKIIENITPDKVSSSIYKSILKVIKK
jgi:glycosyltransferase involved in cell wall biosynthesis